MATDDNYGNPDENAGDAPTDSGEDMAANAEASTIQQLIDAESENSAELKAAATESLQPRSFSIVDWKEYPNSLPQPSGPFRLLEGAEYNAARAAANKANNILRASDDSLSGWQLHEIQPVKFDGDPVDLSNKIPLPAEAHTEATNWWNSLLRDLKRKQSSISTPHE